MNAVVKDMLLGIARHVVAAGGAALVTDGLLMSSQLNDFEGAVLFLLGLGLSIYDKHSRAAAARMPAPAAK